MLQTYGRSILFVAVTVVSAIVAAMTDSTVTANEWVNVAIAGVGAAAVFTAANVPGAAYTKQALAVLTAVLTALASLILGGVSGTEWLQLLVVAAGALGVVAAPSKSTVPNGV